LASGMGLNTGVTLNGANTATPQLRFAGAGARTATLTLTAEAGSGGKTVRVELGPDGSGANGFDRSGLGTNVGGGADPHATARRISLAVTADTVVNDRDFLAFMPAGGSRTARKLPEGAQLTLSVHRIAFTPDANKLHTPNDWGFRLCFSGAATPGADFSVRHSSGRTTLDQEGCAPTNSAEDGTALPADASVARFYITLLHDDLDEGEESVVATLSRTANTGVSGNGLSEFRFAIIEPPLIDKARHYTTEIWRGYDHVLRWQRALHALSGGAEGEGPPMTAAEAQGYAGKGWTRWTPLAAALTALEARSARAEGAAKDGMPAEDDAKTDGETKDEAPAEDETNNGETDTDGEAEEELPAENEAQDAFVPDAALVANIRRWRGETHHGQDHVDRWTRVLIALKVETGSLAPMTAAEAQTYADRGWTRWEPVVAALKALEGGAPQPADEPEAAEEDEEPAAAEESESTEPADDPAPAEEDEEPAAEPELSVSDASGPEGKPMKFTITLSPAAEHRVRVRVETRESSPVSAGENRDYQRNGWWVYFEPGETEQHRWIRAFDDSHDDSGETFEFVLSRARGAVIADAVGVGTIINDDPLPGAYLSRFGRAVAEQALGGIAARMEAPREPGAQGALGGYAFGAGDGLTGDAGLGDPDEGLEEAPPPHWRRFTAGGATGIAYAEPFGGSGGAAAGLHGMPAPPDANLSAAPTPTAQSLTLGDLLLGSRFTLTGGGDARSGSLAFWGQGSRTAFDGAQDEVALSGNVTTALVGVDYTRKRWLMGIALAQSRGSGGYRSGSPATAPSDAAAWQPGGNIKTSLTAAIPYASWRISENLGIWGAFGGGAGRLTLEPESGETLKAGLGWTMAAAGLKSELLALGGGALSLISDALWTRAASDRIEGLAASGGDIVRLRLGLEGKRAFELPGGGSLTPALELGARHDGGDAETGFGIEAGGGLAWNAPRLGIALRIEGRALIAHEDGAISDHGFSASLGYDPSPDSALGLSLALRQQLGGASSGGLNALFANDPLARRGPGHSESETGPGRWAIEAGYGLSAFGGRFVGTPHLGYAAGGHHRDLSLGWRLAPAAGPNAPDLSLGVLAKWRENGQEPPDQGIAIEFRARW
ncbi:MAG: hypothetical protein OXF03_00430, partial [Gammaproteobacteria bacterium]|nr:hypothetical protein [Gammaproteobacteria bacterium]